MKTNKYVEIVQDEMEANYANFSILMERNDVFKASFHGYYLNVITNAIENAYESKLINKYDYIYLMKINQSYLIKIMSALDALRNEGDDNAK